MRDNRVLHLRRTFKDSLNPCLPDVLFRTLLKTPVNQSFSVFREFQKWTLRRNELSLKTLKASFLKKKLYTTRVPMTKIKICYQEDYFVLTFTAPAVWVFVLSIYFPRPYKYANLTYSIILKLDFSYEFNSLSLLSFPSVGKVSGTILTEVRD